MRPTTPSVFLRVVLSRAVFSRAVLSRAVLLLAGALVAGCTIQPDDSARPVPIAERGSFGLQTTGDEAGGGGRIFLVAPDSGEQQSSLRSVLRPVPGDPEAIIESLIAGPNADEQAAGISTQLPADIKLSSAPRLRGRTLTVNVNDVFDNLSPGALRLAVAQIVATAEEIDGVENIRMQIDGENQAWPLGDGQNTDRLLTLYDYPGFVESSQPAYPAIPTAN